MIDQSFAGGIAGGGLGGRTSFMNPAFQRAQMARLAASRSGAVGPGLRAIARPGGQPIGMPMMNQSPPIMAQETPLGGGEEMPMGGMGPRMMPPGMRAFLQARMGGGGGGPNPGMDLGAPQGIGGAPGPRMMDPGFQRAAMARRAAMASGNVGPGLRAIRRASPMGGTPGMLAY